MKVSHELVRLAKIILAERRYDWVEDGDEVVVFVGSKAQSARYYKQNGGARADLHLMSSASVQDGKRLSAPKVGEVWNP